MVLDKTIGVACAPARAYALLSRPERAPEWQPWTARAVGDADGFRMVQDVCGLRLAWRGHVHADPFHVEFQQDEGDFETMEGTWEVVPDEPGPGGGEGGFGERDGAGRGRGQGCLVRLRMRVSLPFVLPRMLTDAEIAECLSRSLDESLYNLKTVLEAPALPSRVRPGAGLPRAWPTLDPRGLA